MGQKTLNLSDISVTSIGAGLFTLKNFLSAAECAAFIADSEEIGYAEAAITTIDGERLVKDIRNNDRILNDNPALATQLFDRALPFLPPDLDGWQPTGLNERMRFYRYTAAQYFAWHQDGSYRRSSNEQSLLTFIIYLNDDYVGGTTQFAWKTVQPLAGTALVFPHHLRHQGAPILSGTKYVLRTDVMYGDTNSPTVQSREKCSY